MDSMQDAQVICFDSRHLRQLILHLHTLTGIWANVLDSSGRDLHLRSAESSFCQAVHSTEEGKSRCVACTLQAVRRCAAARQQGLQVCRCHAGLRQYLIPIGESDTPVAYLTFGQILDSSPTAQQWEQTAALLDWYPGDPEALHQDFLRLRQCSDQEIHAFAEVLQLLSSCIRPEELLRPAAYSDTRRLERYLDQYYMEPLSLKQIAADLHMGTTKLCTLAEKLGGTITQLIARRRVEAAKKLLLGTGCPISEVAEKVGYSDYNYFTRIFKAHTGMTPRTFRKKAEE